MAIDNPKVLAVFVNYHKAARLRSAVESLISCNPDVDLSIVVVDNSCDAGEKAVIEDLALQHSEVAAVYPSRNLGYAAGVNLAVSHGEKGRHILLVSPDVISERSTVRALADLLESDGSMGILAPLQHNDDGTVAEVPRHFPSLAAQIGRRIFRPASTVGIVRSFEGPVLEADWLQSSFVMIRRSLWDQVAGLNERYFLFMADTELCLRSWQAGFRVATCPSIAGLRGDGIRASAGGVFHGLVSRTVRIHLRDALSYYFINGWRAHRRGASSQ